MTASQTNTDAVEAQLAALKRARERTLALVDGIAEPDLVRVHSPLMSPLVWDLGHIAAFQDLWLIHRVGGRPMVREDLAAVYDAFETPRANRGELPFLGPAEARAYLAEVEEIAFVLARTQGVGDGSLHEMVTRHEHQHCETMLQTIQLARLRGYAGAAPGDDTAVKPPPSEAPTGLELVEVPAGSCSIGAAPSGFAYDNERPRHRVEVSGFSIGRTPVTNRAYLEFVSGGGYEQREWWSEPGWQWREREGVARPAGWTEDLSGEWRLGALEPLHPARPVIHVSWFEADAFARAHGARLPSEHEWEKAASWDVAAGGARTYPWGEDPAVPGLHGNFDQLERGAADAGGYPAGDSPYGAADMIGQVWEWTASTFDGYPGFVAHPYREYSEVFFGQGHRVLRGGSWATRARVATTTFRNWDFPVRRQIFAGVRIAK
ncbi:MAG: ergothioneine biosynthesis protein EgtB [Solirubrobacterales bacterium]|nr:ergothioneine biosynthesis protein EgtB [Solirubrobacterales bacterium]